MSNDTISRQAAIEALNKEIIKRRLFNDVNGNGGMLDEFDTEYILRKLPPAEPERKKGKWIEDTFCSECGWIHEVESGFIGSVNQFNYCPNCGARMENGDDT